LRPITRQGCDSAHTEWFIGTINIKGVFVCRKFDAFSSLWQETIRRRGSQSSRRMVEKRAEVKVISYSVIYVA